MSIDYSIYGFWLMITWMREKEDMELRPHLIDLVPTVGENIYQDRQKGGRHLYQ